MQDAFSAASRLNRQDVLICGERLGSKVDGFDLGNSPLEYTRERVGGRTIVLTTTNGTKAMNKASTALTTVAASFLNFSAVVDFVFDQRKNITVFSSGTNGKVSLEDDVCAGMLISEILEKCNGEFQANGNFESILQLASKWKIILIEMMYASRHGQYLAEQGFSGDLEFCSQLNKTEIIPIYRMGIITKWQKEENQKLSPKDQL